MHFQAKENDPWSTNYLGGKWKYTISYLMEWSEKKIAEYLRINYHTLRKHIKKLKKIYEVRTFIELQVKIFEEAHLQHQPLEIKPRKWKIFLLAMEGLNVKEIAQRTGLAVTTVAHYREAILGDNHCHTMHELVLLYYGVHCFPHNE